jgi:hypothetical protein
VWYNHAHKAINESFFKVSSLTIDLNVFRNCGKKVHATFRGGERWERWKSPILQESNAFYAFRVWSIENKCDCLGEYDIHNNDTPKEKK